MISGLVQLQSNTSPQLLTATVSDAALSSLIVAGMAVGLIVPMRLRDYLVGAANHQQSAEAGLP
jgi:hypothetical protein